MARDFRAEIDAAAQAKNWDLVSRLYDERRVAEVEYDEAALDAARLAVAAGLRNAPFDQWCRSVEAGDHDDHPEVQAAISKAASR